MNYIRQTFLILVAIICCSPLLSAQETKSSDELFTEARYAAFEQKNYPKAILLSKQALAKSPDYADISIFLGRIFTWTDQLDSARAIFTSVLQKNPGHEDASMAYGYLEYWNNNSDKALTIADEGLKDHPKAEGLLLLKSKVLFDLKRFEEADSAIGSLLTINPQLSEARSLANRIKDNAFKNKIGVSYDFTHFNKQFDDPWQLLSVDYSRQTKLGSIAARVNYANKFKRNGTQFELDAYPHISNVFYAYVSGGYSNQVGVFPKYRAGFSLYANLPKSFEAEAGFRHLSFGEPTWVYTISAGKYYKNFWFNLRSYLTPSNNSVSQSFSFNTRYYYGGADDYISFGIGTGLSPDDPKNNILYNNGNQYKLKSSNLSLGYRRSFKTFNVLFARVSLDRQEYLPQTKGNQLDLGIGYQRRF